MDNFQVVILALVQGLTEFLPISSSAHLILVPVLTDWPDQGLAFDVAVHAGTLTAVVLYFRKELARMFVEWLASFKGRLTPDARLAWAVLIGTIPVGLAGLIFKDLIETESFYISSVFVDNKPVGMFYTDRHTADCYLDEASYQRFKQITQLTGKAMEEQRRTKKT